MAPARRTGTRRHTISTYHRLHGLSPVSLGLRGLDVQIPIEEAWISWMAGSAGVGAVLVDETGSVVAKGRNRTTEQSGSHLSGTIMAHAEMDALSQVPFGTRITGSLYTTFEPCIMSAATIAFYRVPEVHFAAADPFFDGLDWMGGYPFTADRLPVRVRLGGPIGAFCHVLHLAWLVAYPAPPNVIDAHRRLTPSTFECADQSSIVIVSGRSHSRRNRPRSDPELWPDLKTLSV